MPDRPESADEDIRHAVLNYAHRWAAGDFGSILPRLHLLYERLNKEFFEGKLPPNPLIVIEPAPAPRVNAWYSNRSGWGGRLKIGIATRIVYAKVEWVQRDDGNLEGLFRVVDDLFIHEVIHVNNDVVERCPERGHHGHGSRFAAWCNRIGMTMGIPEVRNSRARKNRHLPSCAQWPLNVRPEGHYMGAIRYMNVPEGVKDFSLETEVREELLSVVLDLLEVAKALPPGPDGVNAFAKATVLALRRRFEKDRFLFVTRLFGEEVSRELNCMLDK